MGITVRGDASMTSALEGECGTKKQTEGREGDSDNGNGERGKISPENSQTSFKYNHYTLRWPSLPFPSLSLWPMTMNR